MAWQPHVLGHLQWHWPHTGPICGCYSHLTDSLQGSIYSMCIIICNTRHQWCINNASLTPCVTYNDTHTVKLLKFIHSLCLWFGNICSYHLKATLSIMNVCNCSKWSKFGIWHYNLIGITAVVWKWKLNWKPTHKNTWTLILVWYKLIIGC